MNPQIEFSHVLGELSVNRNDPCEVLRELISNSYDAGAKNICFIPVKDRSGLVFLDDGTGLDSASKINGITPWEAFFSIGKSTKKKGDAIGYKCQGTKLCFASSRILVAAKANSKLNRWDFKVIDNPRTNLDTNFDISPETTQNIGAVLDKFFTNPNADTTQSIAYLKSQLATFSSGTGTLIVIDGLDTESFSKYFAVGYQPDESYVYNYIRFYTRHGDVRHITSEEGFSASQRKQVNSPTGAKLTIYANKKAHDVAFGYPYLPKVSDPSIKSPMQVSRLRDGRFVSRSAKQFAVGADKYSLILAIDGNRRAHDEYKHLARKGKAMSGIRLSDHRGVFIAVKGIKICKYQDLLSSLADYEVLSEGDSPTHYLLVLEGDFDLVTNRNALSKKAYDTLSNADFLAEVKKFLDTQRSSDPVFAELLARLRRESSENMLNEQIEILDEAKKEIKTREKFRVVDPLKKEHLFLSPQPGEEYLVGVLYSQLTNLLPSSSVYEKYWKRVITFSTQGIDSLGLRAEGQSNPLSESNVCSIEYKFEFHNNGPFNHALAVVDYIVAWNVEVDTKNQVKDTYTCFGNIKKIASNNFEWEISGIENMDGGKYDQKITVICLKDLIVKTFGASFSAPPK